MQLYLDLSGGVSGDMTLGALAHLGLDLSALQGLLKNIGIDCTIACREERRAGGPGRRVDVSWPATQPLRHPADIAGLISRLDMGGMAKEKALAVLDGLTRAEAAVHNVLPEHVHFHEVGAVDTLVDIAGACWGLEKLGIDRVTASPFPWFTGHVECAHGRIPLPAPAAARLMQGKPVRPSSSQEELVTPTGAALVHVLVDEFLEGGPCGRLAALGTGYGSRPSPTGLRAWLYEPAGDEGSGRRGTDGFGQFVHEQIVQLETHIDHLTGEEIGAALTALTADDCVLDALWLAGIGKKNRPAGLMRVLCLPRNENAVMRLLFRHTHTLGIRRHLLDRVVLPRRATEKGVGDEMLQAKEYVLEGQGYLRAEADALAASACERGVGMPALRFLKNEQTLTALTPQRERTLP